MANENIMPEEEEVEIYTLTDEDGKESDFELIGSTVIDEITYMAMAPVDEDSDEYVILKMIKDENGEDMLETIENDDEFDKVADIFDDMLFGEEDYDK